MFRFVGLNAFFITGFGTVVDSTPWFVTVEARIAITGISCSSGIAGLARAIRSERCWLLCKKARLPWSLLETRIPLAVFNEASIRSFGVI